MKKMLLLNAFIILIFAETKGENKLAPLINHNPIGEVTHTQTN